MQKKKYTGVAEPKLLRTGLNLWMLRVYGLTEWVSIQLSLYQRMRAWLRESPAAHTL